MTDLPAPRAARLRRPRWRDTRLLVGVLLVLASVALGSLAVGHADDRTPVFAARGPLVPGQRLTDQDLRRVDVQLGAELDHYLSAAAGLAPDRFVLRDHIIAILRNRYGLEGQVPDSAERRRDLVVQFGCGRKPTTDREHLVVVRRRAR